MTAPIVPTITCGCGLEVVSAYVGPGDLAIDPTPVPRGPWVLTQARIDAPVAPGEIHAQRYDPDRHDDTRRRWVPHVCRDAVPGEAWVAIDFETADSKRDSACSMALVRVESERVVERKTWLIRPPRPDMPNAAVHGITWGQVRNAPAMAEVWRKAGPLLEGALFIAAHNVGFDRSVLKASLGELPETPWLCTLALAKKTWQLGGYKLSDVAAYLQIELQHHVALSDAHACAQILLRARERAGASWDWRRHGDWRTA